MLARIVYVFCSSFCLQWQMGLMDLHINIVRYAVDVDTDVHVDWLDELIN
jgi:hypothetical protein